MILLCSIFFVIAATAFFLAHSLSMPKRLLLFVVLFFIPNLIMGFALIKIGDKALPGSRTITPEELELEGVE